MRKEGEGVYRRLRFPASLVAPEQPCHPPEARASPRRCTRRAASRNCDQTPPWPANKQLQRDRVGRSREVSFLELPSDLFIYTPSLARIPERETRLFFLWFACSSPPTPSHPPQRYPQQTASCHKRPARRPGCKVCLAGASPWLPRPLRISMPTFPSRCALGASHVAFRSSTPTVSLSLASAHCSAL